MSRVAASVAIAGAPGSMGGSSSPFDDELDRSAPLDRGAIAWLLAFDEPSVRWLAATSILGLPRHDPRVVDIREGVLNGPRVRQLLAGQGAAGGFGVDAYAKWAGTHWRLLALAELEVPPDARQRAAAEHELAWIGSAGRRRRATNSRIEGRMRWCGSQDGAALVVCTRLGMAGDRRVAEIAANLVAWQWPDGGWNCDRKPGATHSSFNESLKPMWGLAAYAAATGDRDAAEAADRTAEYFLRHRIFRSERTGEPYERLLRPHFPTYWHYDALDGLLVLMRMDRLDDPRTADALDELQARRGKDGMWRAGGRHWRTPGSNGSNVEIVDWGTRGANPWITLNALRVLRAAGRL
jgi:hypothetical protein